MKKWYTALAIFAIALLVIPVVAFAASGYNLMSYHFNLNPGYSAKGNGLLKTTNNKQELLLYVSNASDNNKQIDYVNLVAKRKMLFGIMQQQAEIKIMDPQAGDRKEQAFSLDAGEFEYITKAYGEQVSGSVNVRYDIY